MSGVLSTQVASAIDSALRRFLLHSALNHFSLREVVHPVIGVLRLLRLMAFAICELNAGGGRVLPTLTARPADLCITERPAGLDARSLAALRTTTARSAGTLNHRPSLRGPVGWQVIQTAGEIFTAHPDRAAHVFRFLGFPQAVCVAEFHLQPRCIAGVAEVDPGHAANCRSSPHFDQPDQ